MASNFLTTSQNKGAFPDSSMFPAGEVIPDALVLTQSTRGPLANGDSPRVHIPYVAETPAAAIIAEGEQIANTKPALSELVVNTKKIALLTALSNEATNTDGVENLMSTSLKQGIVKKADALFLANQPADPATLEPVGLANTPGIVDGGDITDSINPLLETLGTLGDNGATPSSIVMGYGTWAKLLRLADANGDPLIAKDVANSPMPALYGIPVVLNSQAPKDTMIVIDRTMVLSSVSDVSLSISSEVFFDYDSTAIRITMRIGFGVIRPNRIAKLTVAATK